MGLHSINRRKNRHASKANVHRRVQKQTDAKHVGKVVEMEGVELLSKDQLKKLAKNPTNNIRPSGKRKRKMMKRLRHSQREKNTMEIEVADAPGPSKPKSKSKSKAKKSEDTEMKEDDDDDEDDVVEDMDEEMA